MDPIDANELLEKMLKAVKKSLEDKWPQVRDLARSEFGKFARNIEDIKDMKKRRKITKAQAALQLDIQKNSIKTVLLTEEGLGLLAVEAAINAALDAIRATVNKAIGWALL
jgi:ACT domain-containing protein